MDVNLQRRGLLPLRRARSRAARTSLETGEIHATSYLVKGLPKNTRVYVSVWTKANGVWNGTASTFVTR